MKNLVFFGVVISYRSITNLVHINDSKVFVNLLIKIYQDSQVIPIKEYTHSGVPYLPC